MPGCGAALHNGDCCGWEQGELITLLFEAWAAQLCCASFKNDKRLSKERGFVLRAQEFCPFKSQEAAKFLFCFLHTWPTLEPGQHRSLFGLTDTDFMPSERRTPEQTSALATKRHGVIALSTVPECRLLSPRHITALQHGQGFAKHKFISKPPPPWRFCFQGHFSI